MKVVLASDHRGYKLKDGLIDYLDSRWVWIYDVGCHGESVDYPMIAKKAITTMRDNDAHRCILVCGTGIEMCLAANAFKDIRCAVCNDVLSAEMSRRHNDTNVLALGADIITLKEAEKIISVWFGTPFEGGSIKHDT